MTHSVLYMYICLTVMNISFGVTRYLVLEGGGCVELTLMKSSGAVGAVSVNLTTLDGTAG